MTLASRPVGAARGGGPAQALWALLAQTALLVAFLWTPLSRYGEVHYTSADLLQVMSLTQVVPGHRPGNQLLSDAVTQMQPWALFNREELRDGRFPLWNPHNGTGTPHFANYQSAVLSPFSLPFYVLDLKPALLASAALRLAVLGWFTYLFLRRIGCGWLAATAGGAAFQFAGHNVVLLGLPHVSALSALPAGMYFAELALGRVEDALAAGARARLAGPLAGLALSFALGLLAGNPEPFYFAALAVGAWTAARLVGAWRAARASRAGRREVARAAGLLAFAALAGAGLAAMQVLPFLDYAGRSLVLQHRSSVQTPLALRWWPLAQFPDALGNPSSAYTLGGDVPPPNYELVTMSYTGGAALLLAALCALVAHARRGGLFFPLAAAFWFVYAHDLGGAARLLAHLPTVGLAPMNRSQGVWAFFVACAAALALDALLARRGARAPFLAFWTLAASAAWIVACLIGADRLIEAFSATPSPYHASFASHVPPHLAAMSAWTATAAAACAALLVARARAVRLAAGLAIGAALFAQSGWLLRDYNPACPDALVFPRTDALAGLARHVGDERLAVLGQDSLPPDSNLAYGLSLLESYDGMAVGALDLLYRDRFGEGDNWRPILRGSAGSLRLFGTRWVLAKWGWNFLDAGLRTAPRDAAPQPARLALGPGREATQTFRCEADGLSCLMVVLSARPEGHERTLRLRLEDPESGATLVEQTLGGRAILASLDERTHLTWPGEPVLAPAGRPVVFRFPPVVPSAGRVFRVILECPDGFDEDTLYAWHMPSKGYGPGLSTYRGRELPGELLFDWTCGAERRFEVVDTLGDYELLRLRDAVGPFVPVDDVVLVGDDASALEILRCGSFDPRRALVLVAEDDEARRAAAEAERAARERRVVQFEGSDHCYLVSADGRELARIDDEVTFLANRFQWKQIRRLPAAERAGLAILPDSDRAARERVGLRQVGTRDDRGATLEVLERTPVRVLLRSTRPRPGHLLAIQSYDPGWRARIDGREVPLVRANFAFQAVALPAGACEVELFYLPRSLVVGLWISAGTALLCLGALLAGRLRAGPARA